MRFFWELTQRLIIVRSFADRRMDGVKHPPTGHHSANASAVGWSVLRHAFVIENAGDPIEVGNYEIWTEDLYMSADVISLIKDIATILFLFFGALIGVFVFFQFSPVLVLRILPRWTDETRQFLILKFEIENKSRVRANKPRGQIQVLEYAIKSGASLSHWVPFDKNAIRSGELPIEWREPVKILETTKQIYPGGMVSFERLYYYPQDSVIIHVGLQVELELGFLGRVVNLKGESWRQTTTCFVVKQAEAKSAASNKALQPTADTELA